MRVSQLVGPKTSEVITVDTPKCGPLDVLVKMKLCGVCASELPRWRQATSTSPMRLGHEPVGVVAEIGSEVSKFNVGDRVTGLFNSAYAQYALSPESILLPIPDNVPEEGALGEPLACLVNAINRTSIQLADTLVLIGAGYMGLGFLQLARLKGPARTVVIDVRQESLDLARTMGATETYTPDQVPEDLFLTEFSDWKSDRGADVVVEASGTQPGLEMAGKLVKAHGTLSILGYHQGANRSVDVGMWNWKAIDVINAHVRRQEILLESMRIGLELESAGLIDFGPLVSHRFDIDHVDEAYATLETKPEGFVKSVIQM